MHPAWLFLIDLVPPSEVDREEVMRRAIVPKDQGEWSASVRRYAKDEGFRMSCIRNLLSRFHAWTLDEYFREVNEIQYLVHPWMEVVANPFHVAALFVANGVRVAHDRHCPLTERVLAHTTSQLLWRETAPDSTHKWGDVVGTMPALHPLVRARLCRKER